METDQGIGHRRLTRRQAGFLVLAGCGLVARAAAASPAEPSQSSELDVLLERVRRERALPGLAAAVVGPRGTVAAVAGVRRWAGHDQIYVDDRFHIASCTKSWTATLAAIAVHRGQLRWTTVLADGLPTLASRMRKEYASVTLEQLLAHEGRLPAYTQPSTQRALEMRALSGTPPEQRLVFLEQVLNESPNGATGDGAYSNAGYTAVGAMLERAMGSPWEELVRHELARPLGLTTIGFGYPAASPASTQPHGHARQGDKVLELPLDESRELAVCLWPAGAVHCSIGDLAKYAADHLNGLRGRTALLPPASYHRLHRQRGDSVFTLGWGVSRDQRWGVIHFGSGSGGWFFVRIVIVPEHDAAVVIASNSGDAGPALRELWPRLVEFARA